ncbi:MAG: PIN domain-containing protein [Chloroflexi bacterium]|nr:PIN domain-containing protein [Chloroflexota bacterium]
MRFVDTNVLLYGISRDASESGKAARAQSLLRDRDLGLSVQVLQEFYVQATRPTRPDALTHGQASGLVESFLRFRVQSVDVRLMRAALVTRDRYRLSYWDAAIIEAARALGCGVVLSEDLAHGQDYGGVQVVDPFRD